MSERDQIERQQALFQQAFSDAIPHNKALGIGVVAVRRGHGSMTLPYDKKLIGNPQTGVLHGGAITALLDACSGMAVATMLANPQPFATLDLRIDYLRPATPGQDVIAEAECFKVTSNVAFTRAFAHHGDRNDPIASATGTFMLATKGRSSLQDAAIEAADPASDPDKRGGERA